MPVANGNGSLRTQEEEKEIKNKVQEYYGKILQKSNDLKTDACCTKEEFPMHIKSIMKEIDDEVIERYYGCGLCIPNLLEGCRVLDLGSGAGRDCFIVSKLVGPNGYVVGVDMTEEQLEVARKHIPSQMKKFGYSKPNIEFKKGFIEKLDELDLEDNSFDVIVSNCVINLSPDKQSVLEQAFRVLKPGGELYFSDVYSDRRISKELQENEVLWGECLSGAMYTNDFLNLAKKVGFLDPRKVKEAPVNVNDKSTAIKELVKGINFVSTTYRLFKFAKNDPNPLEPQCEDYGQAVIYKGTIPHCEKSFQLDDGHFIETGKVFPICGNSLKMLIDTRFKVHFDVVGEGKIHYGSFPCGPDSTKKSSNSSSNSASCC